MSQVVSLQESLGLPRSISLSRDLWVAAAVLGHLRTAVNNEHRAARRDRGGRVNIQNDLQGSLGELIGLGLLERNGLSKPAEGLLDLQQHVDRPDLTTRTDPPISLDVKCHFDEANKRLFLINEEARKRSIKRGVQAFLPIATALAHQEACLGELIPIESLAAWHLGTLGWHRDPCRQLPLVELGRKFLDRPRLRWQLQEPTQWGPELLTGEDFEHLAQLDWAKVLLTLREEGFSLDGVSYQKVKEALLGVLPTDLRNDLGLI